MPALDRFVVVHNRSRDRYEVAAALAEAGLLERLVTDFYAPAPLARLSGFFARRHHPAIAWPRSTSAWSSFAAQAVAQLLRLPMERVFPATDRLLASRAAQVARRTGSALLCYSSYVPQRSATGGLPVIDFEYHPHPRTTFDILRDDHRRFPECDASFARERLEVERSRDDEPWRRADRVLCASTMTRRSLEAAGCDPASIEVVPYGCSEPEAPMPREPGRCRFLFVGQGIQRKGLHHLIRAWQTRPRPGASLTLVCYHVDPGIAALIADPSIRLLPRQEPERLAALYRSSDVFVMPSLVEGFGLVYLEALAHGCHVIGTSNTGLSDLALGREAATIVAPGALEAIDEEIDRLIARKRAGVLAPEAIMAATQRWQWADFRRAIAASAASALASWNAG